MIKRFSSCNLVKQNKTFVPLHKQHNTISSHGLHGLPFGIIIYITSNVSLCNSPGEKNIF